MQGLSAFRVAHCCCSSFGGRSRVASPAPQQHPLSLGFQQGSCVFKCGREVLAPALRRIKTAAQEEAITEDSLPSLAEEKVSLKLADEEVSLNLAEEDVSTNNVAVEEEPKVKVKFILEKKCQFGQRFNVVGDHPLFGNWDVKAAVPMAWSEGDIWTVEVDVPVEKKVEFKFVLTGASKEIEWQPGSNRVFDTVEGISPLVVNEAWIHVDGDEAEEAAGDELSDLAEDTTPSETNGILVPADIITDATPDEVVKALESNNGADAPKLETNGIPVPADMIKDAIGDDVVKALESNNGADVPESEPETLPETPVAELDVVGASMKTALSSVDILTEG